MAQAGDVVAAKYRLIHPLGIGGMGAVWRCEHMQLKLQMAVKLLDARGPAAERAVQRFTREARIAASVRHRNVVSITDFGADGGAPYLVMELLQGVPLSERLVVAEPLSVAAFLRVIEQALQGLKAVHEKGVIHRDLKPENIFLVRDEGASLTKLLDFGVSRSVERDKGHTITRDGIVMGTPEYIAPEQARGKMPDARSDLYSLGVVMYEALAGRLPFHADNAADVIVAVLNATPVPLDSLRPELGTPICTLVTKALAKKPQDRFQTAEEMRLAVLDALQKTPDIERQLLPKRFVSVAPPPELTPHDVSDPPSDFVDDSDKPTVAHRTVPVPWGKLAVLSVAGFISATALTALFFVERPSDPARAAENRPSRDDRAASAISRPSADVEVELVGVPADGRVLVDGTEVVGTTVRLVRGSGEHAIEVRAPGKKPWGVPYDATQNGRFVLVLEADEDMPALAPELAPVAEPVRPKRSAPTKAKPPEPSSPSTLLRTPDF